MKMTIEEYIGGMEGWQAEAVRTLVDLVCKAVPEAKETRSGEEVWVFGSTHSTDDAG